MEAARRALEHRMYLKALLLALRLKEAELLEHVLLSTPKDQVASAWRTDQRGNLRPWACEPMLSIT